MNTVKAVITLQDNTVLELGPSNLMQGGFNYSRAITPDNVFCIGSAIINDSDLMINNYKGEYDLYDFTDANVKLYIGETQEDEATIWYQKGEYTVDEPTFTTNTIKLSNLDNMSKFDKPYSESALSYPATISEILNNACTDCNVQLKSQILLNSSYVVTERPANDNLSYRDIISFIAQISCSNAIMDLEGKLEFRSFNKEYLNDKLLDGGDFKQYGAELVDGGDFKNYNGELIDGGTFEELDDMFHIYRFSSMPTIATEDIKITGVSITLEDGTTYLYGQNGYVVNISNNSLIQDNYNDLVTSIGEKLVGLTFRPFSGTALSNHKIDAGDYGVISNRKGSYRTFLSRLEYKFGKYENFSCDAESKLKNNSNYMDNTSKIIQATKKQVEQKLTAFEQASKQLNDLMVNAMGYYSTKLELPDGSIVDYTHDKPTLAESTKIWKKTADAFAVSTDGGKTWNAGITADGNIIAQTLNVIGINAEWINVGTLRGIKIYVEQGGKIGNLVVTNQGLQSNTIQLLDNIAEPILWMNSPDGLQHANYQANAMLVTSRDVIDGIEKQCFIDARQGYSSAFTISEADYSGGSEVIKKRTEYSISGILVDGILGAEEENRSYTISAGGTSIVLAGEDVYINGQSWNETYQRAFNTVSQGGRITSLENTVSSQANRITQLMNDMSTVKSILGIS